MAESKYPTSFDLSLSVGESDNASYPIHAESNWLGKTCSAKLPDSEAQKLSRGAEQLQSNSSVTDKNLEDFGRCLFEALLRDQVRDMLRILEGQNTEGRNLYLMLDLRPHILQRLPWECMFDPYHKHFLSLQNYIHVIRKVERSPEASPGKVLRGLSKFVIAVANPSNETPLDEEGIEKLKNLADKFRGRYIQGREAEMREALAQVPNVFHFVGHGGINRDNDDPGLYLEDYKGDADFVSAKELVQKYFTPPPDKEGRVNLVILSACNTSATPKPEGISSLACQLISQVDTVLAMQYPIGLENLSKYNNALYDACLGLGFTGFGHLS